MIFALLPVKSPKNAKQRLKNLLSAEQRENLARKMYEQVLSTLCSVSGIDYVVIVTSDEQIAAHANSCGLDVFLETDQVSHSHSADRAAARAESMGAKSVILLPIDVPLMTKDEIELLVASAHHGLIVVPSADGTGTNALVRSPPGAVPACFGPGSFRRHCEEAESRGVALKVMRPPGILFDIDTPEDIAELLDRAPDSSVGRFISEQLSFKVSRCD